MEAVISHDTSNISVAELVKLCAVDSELYGRTFFPKTFRQKSPLFHKEIWDILENPAVRYPNIQSFRDSAKTTLCRVFSSKRIAYGISKTILYVGVSEAHATRSLFWLRSQIEKNRFWAETFGLRIIKKGETELLIGQRLPGDKEETQIWILGVGITGNVRGINFDDYRPDLIILDDIINDENAATQEQRDKISNLVLGALKDSLAPATEEPNAKMPMLTTPQNAEDAASLAAKDEEFKTLIFPCWTKETMDLPVHLQESSWPERYPSEQVRQQKLLAMKRNKLSIFTREKEVRLTSKETVAFFSNWLTIPDVYAEHPFCILGVDPVPPPSDAQRAKGFEGKDWEVHAVWGRENGQYYLMEYMRNRGHDPNWSMMAFFTLAYKYRIARAVVETVAYQRVLKWILENEMKRRRLYYQIVPYNDKRKKSTRIISTFSGIASQGIVNIRPEHTEFMQEFTDFSETQDGVDDILDASSMALSELINPALELGGSQYNDDEVEELLITRSAP